MSSELYSSENGKKNPAYARWLSKKEIDKMEELADRMALSLDNRVRLWVMDSTETDPEDPPRGFFSIPVTPETPVEIIKALINEKYREFQDQGLV